MNKYRKLYVNYQICSYLTSRGGGGGVLRISSDTDDRRVVLGSKFSISGFFGGRKILASIFFGSLI